MKGSFGTTAVGSKGEKVKVTLEAGKIGEVLLGEDGNSQAKRVIHLAIAGGAFLAEDDVVRLDVDTVDATDVLAVVNVCGTVEGVIVG